MGSTRAHLDSSARFRVTRWVNEEQRRGRLRRGDVLPSERDLATKLGVSRTAVRAAFLDLQDRGVVEIRRGERRRRLSGGGIVRRVGRRRRARLFGTDGIRGQANSYPVTPEVALQLGKAMAQVLRGPGTGSQRVIIGKDTRLSGYMLETALTSGLVSMGMDVLLVGPMPTPAVAHLTKSMGATAGIMLTASHNPYDDNGIKLFGSSGFKISDAVEERIETHVHAGDLRSDHIRSDRIGKAYRIEDARGRYIEFAKHTIQDESLHNLKIALDCGNGAAYLIGPLIFRELGASVFTTGVSPDGFNINAGCGATNPECVAELVREHRADVGIAFDGDADRVIFCDAAGRVVDGDRILAMCAIDHKQRGTLREETLVVTAMSNMGLHISMKNHGIRVLTTEVGDRHVIECMRDRNLVLGGEKCGHVIFFDHVTTGDGIITALQVLTLMRQTGASLADLADCMDEYPQRLVNVPVAEPRPLEELGALQAALYRCHRELGEHGRTVVRYSGTENQLRILVECPDPGLAASWADTLARAAREDLDAHAAPAGG